MMNFISAKFLENTIIACWRLLTAYSVLGISSKMAVVDSRPITEQSNPITANIDVSSPRSKKNRILPYEPVPFVLYVEFAHCGVARSCLVRLLNTSNSALEM